MGHARAIAKLGFDQAVATVLLLLLLPLFVLVAILIKLDSPGPVLFRLGFLGKDKRPFQRLKFRTMHTNESLELMHEALRRLEAGDKRDPRVTRVGRVLRRLRIDMLPQILNVVAGDLSLVGPRPACEPERNRFGTADRERFSVRPGIWLRDSKGCRSRPSSK